MISLKYYFHDKPSSLLISHTSRKRKKPLSINQITLEVLIFSTKARVGNEKVQKLHRSITYCTRYTTYIGSFYYGNPFPHVVQSFASQSVAASCRLLKFYTVLDQFADIWLRFVGDNTIRVKFDYPLGITIVLICLLYNFVFKSVVIGYWFTFKLKIFNSAHLPSQQATLLHTAQKIACTDLGYYDLLHTSCDACRAA